MKRTVYAGNVPIGGGFPVTVQSMTSTKTKDAEATLAQISALTAAGCDIVRVTVNDDAAAAAMRTICAESPLPVVADIHFNYKYAVASAEAGAAKIRINPGNIGSPENVRYLAKLLKERKIPIRIGVNGGSLESDILAKFGQSAAALKESALRHAKILEDCSFYDIVISVKSSSVPEMLEAYRMLDKECDYPLHLGVTEAGAGEFALIKSAVGIGTLLAEGIGSTIRVSLSGDPVKEVMAGKEILRALKMQSNYCEVVACPTCGRTEIDVEGLALKVEKATAGIVKPLRIAVMGCVVNGPGEAKECDFGVAGGKERSVLFIKGKPVRTVKNEDILSELLALIGKSDG